MKIERAEQCCSHGARDEKENFTLKIETYSHEFQSSQVTTQSGSEPQSDASASAWRVAILSKGGALRASSVLACRGNDVAVFDTGLAQHESSVISALAAHQITPENVTHVFNTHLHVDHSHNNVLFTNARIYCSARDLAWARTLHETMDGVARPTPQDVLNCYPEMISVACDSKIVSKVLGIQKMLWDEQRWGRRDQFVWLEESAMPAGILAVETPGHSPFHVSYIIETTARPVLVAGDALFVRGESEASLYLVPPYSLEAYRRSQSFINAFDGIIVPGHDEPFDNLPFDNHV
jgi:glyoxylase-like metal-dependent hydrolase (beta-lactamase superfamily II)